jgi:hypothetical protein
MKALSNEEKQVMRSALRAYILKLTAGKYRGQLAPVEALKEIKTSVQIMRNIDNLKMRKHEKL